MEPDNNFTVLENKAIGRNISIYRKIRGLKASDLAERLDMKETTYTRYERGEGAITVDLLQQVAEVLNVDPITLLSVHPSNFIENSSNFIAGNHNTWSNNNEEKDKMILNLMERVITLLEKEK